MNDESDHSHDSCSSSSSSSSSSSFQNSSSHRRADAPRPPDSVAASCWDDHPKNDNNDDCWTLQIRRVGETEPDFGVTVHPTAPLQSLWDQIGRHTGWSAAEQRLIYRGRLLMPPTEPQMTSIQDVTGLTDGHTIHLLRRPPPPQTPLLTDNTNMQDESNPHLGHEPTSEVELPASSPSSSLLAALLGVGNNNNNHNNSNGDDDDNNHNNQRVPYRLQESDLIRPDPGSLEAVRQGLLTLHTLQAAAVPGASRPFYLGQWIDCRDTVNQWLEATVVHIVDPAEVLPDLKTDRDEEEEDEVEETVEDGKSCSCRSNATAPGSAMVTPTSDPAIAVTDLDGRRRLLLEPCEEHEAEEHLDGVYYRRRSNNAAVQLLHIHYNGWPVRWDEWIRSDSERIRPFRVRTRHAPQTHTVSPMVHTLLPDPPRTCFTTMTATEPRHERDALLPELYRAVDRVQELLQRAAAAAEPVHVGGTASPHLPWNAAASGITTTTTTRTVQERQSELQTLAPLLDRLGRVLTDAAPHVAALATSLQQQQQHDPSSSNSEDDEHEDDSKRNHNPHTLGGLLSLLSRDRRGHEQSVASSNAAVPSLASWASGNEHGTIVEDDEDDEEEEEETPIDPDLSDFRTGFVNAMTTTRGGGGESRRRSAGTTNSEELASLLGAYLAAASLGGAAGNITTIGEDGSDGAEDLGRLLRGGTNGIDIHIHAIVTTPTGLFTREPRLLSVPPPPPPPTTMTAATFTAAHAETTITTEDDGIFAALYSENPDAVNMNVNQNGSEEATASNQTSTSSSSVAQNNDNNNTSDHQRRRHRSSSSRRSNNNNGPTSSSSSNSSSGVLGRFFRRDRSNH